MFVPHVKVPSNSNPLTDGAEKSSIAETFCTGNKACPWKEVKLFYVGNKPDASIRELWIDEVSRESCSGPALKGELIKP